MEMRHKQNNCLVGDINASPSVADRPVDKKKIINREDLNKTIDQHDITNIYVTLPPTTAQYSFLSSTPNSLFQVRPYTES